jgi:hypothetical protein
LDFQVVRVGGLVNVGAEITERGDHGGVVGAELDGRVFNVDGQGVAQLAA